MNALREAMSATLSVTRSSKIQWISIPNKNRNMLPLTKIYKALKLFELSD